MEPTVSVVELTEQLGLPADRQNSVATWTGEDGLWDGTRWAPRWTEAEAAELVKIWHEQYAAAVEGGQH